MSTEETVLHNPLAIFPEYFYFNQMLYKLDKISGVVSLVKDDEPCPNVTEGLVETEDVSARINYVQGRVLTIIEAAITDKGQQKAVKDLIKQVMTEEHSRLSDSVTGFQTLSEGDMVQFGGGSVEKFYENQVEPVTMPMGKSFSTSYMPGTKEHEEFVKNLKN